MERREAVENESFPQSVQGREERHPGGGRQERKLVPPLGTETWGFSAIWGRREGGKEREGGITAPATMKGKEGEGRRKRRRRKWNEGMERGH